jgi:hypothetical protein
MGAEFVDQRHGAATPAVLHATPPWAVQSVLWFLVIFELSPASQPVRLAVLAWALVAFGSPAAAALAYGLTTLLIEAAAGISAAVLVTSAPARGRRIAAEGRQRLQTWLAERGPVHPAFVPGLAVLGGTAVTTWTRHLGPVRRSRRELTVYALVVATALGLLSAVQGALVAAGIAFPGPATVGVALLSLIAVPVALWLKRRRARDQGIPNRDVVQTALGSGAE